MVEKEDESEEKTGPCCKRVLASKAATLTTLASLLMRSFPDRFRSFPVGVRVVAAGMSFDDATIGLGPMQRESKRL